LHEARFAFVEVAADRHDFDDRSGEADDLFAQSDKQFHDGRRDGSLSRGDRPPFRATLSR
jgi:hypothetical protein